MTMQLERHLPSAALKPYIKAFLLVASTDGMVSQILPDTSISLAFRVAGSVAHVENGDHARLPASVISGLRKSARRLEYAQNSATLVVQFRETGAAPFFREPLHELFGASLALDTLLAPHKVAMLEERLAEAKNMATRITLVEEFMHTQFQEPEQGQWVQQAVRAMQRAQGDIRIGDLAAGLPISQDAFEKRFKRAIGASPKQFARIVRLRSVIDRHSPGSSLTDTALAAGYFDQAHFIKDFRAFTGATPSEFFRSPAFW